MTVNEAIIRIITCRLKRDEKEAFQLIKKEGYTTYKSRDGWVVESPKTKKNISYGYNYWEKDKVLSQDYINHMIIYRPSVCKADLKAYLDKPMNEYRLFSGYAMNKAQERMQKLNNLKYRIMRCTKENKEITERISELQREAENNKVLLQKYTEELNSLKEEYGLKKAV